MACTSSVCPRAASTFSQNGGDANMHTEESGDNGGNRGDLARHHCRPFVLLVAFWAILSGALVLGGASGRTGGGAGFAYARRSLWWSTHRSPLARSGSTRSGIQAARTR